MNVPLRWSRLWDRISIYLPLLLMFLLALGTYWLVRSAPSHETPPELPSQHKPDYFMYQISVSNFDADGRLRDELVGDQARHYPDTLTLEVDAPKIRAIDKQGRITLIHANRSLSNQDNSEVQLLGNASITREASTDSQGKAQPYMQLQGEFLHFFRNTEQVRSHKPVVVTQGNNRFTSDSLLFDNLDRTVDMKGRVKGTIYPDRRPSSGSTQP